MTAVVCHRATAGRHPLGSDNQERATLLCLADKADELSNKGQASRIPRPRFHIRKYGSGRQRDFGEVALLVGGKW